MSYCDVQAGCSLVSLSIVHKHRLEPILELDELVLPLVEVRLDDGLGVHEMGRGLRITRNVVPWHVYLAGRG